MPRITVRRAIARLVAAVFALIALPVTAAYAQAPALNPQDPPGWSKVETIINWAAKLTIAACFAGFLITAATMAVQHRRGTLGPEAVGQFGVVMFACVLVGASGGIVNKLV